MSTRIQHFQVPLNILTFSIELNYQDQELKYPEALVYAELNDQPQARSVTVLMEADSSRLFELKFREKVYASGVLKYLAKGKDGPGIYGELVIGEPGQQSFFNQLILSLPQFSGQVIPSTPIIPGPPIVPVSPVIPGTPVIPEEPVLSPAYQDLPPAIQVENAAFSDLFNFVGLQRPSQIPQADRQEFFFDLDTGSDFYQSLLQAIQEQKPLAPLAQAFLDSCGNMEIIREVLDQDLYLLIERFEQLKEQLQTEEAAAGLIGQMGLVGLMGLQSLEQSFLEILVETLEDGISAVMILVLGTDENQSQLQSEAKPEVAGDALTFEKFLLLLRLINYYLRILQGRERDYALSALEALVILPQEVFASVLASTSSQDAPTVQGSLSPLGIGEMLVLKKRAYTYSLGEIARIENVMVGEQKIRRLEERSLDREEDRAEKDQSRYQWDQVQSDTQYDLLQEIAQLVGDQKQSFQYAPAGGSSNKAVSGDASLNRKDVAGASSADGPSPGANRPGFLSPESSGDPRKIAPSDLNASSSPCADLKGLVKCFGPNQEVLSGGWTLDLDPSGNLEQQSLSYVKDLLNLASSRLSRKSRSQHARILERERRRIDKHIFDNREGSAPLIGIYRWLNRVDLARLVSLGQRLLIQFDIPHPASGLEAEFGQTPEPDPPPLALLKQADYTVLTAEIYFQYAAQLGVRDLLPPPPATRSVSASLNSAQGDWQIILEIPEGYLAQSLQLGYLYNGSHFSAMAGAVELQKPTKKSGTADSKAPKDAAKAETTASKPPKGAVPVVTSDSEGTAVHSEEAAGSASLGETPDQSPITPVPFPPPPSLTPQTIQSGSLQCPNLKTFASSVPVSILTDATYYTVNLVLDCELSPQSLDLWKVKAWGQLLKALEDQEESDSQAPPQSTEYRVRAQQYALIRKTLENRALAILRANLRDNKDQSPPPEWDDYLRDAFLWREMSIQFLSTNESGPLNDWRELDGQGPDPRQFNDFLLAKTARVVVGLKDQDELGGLYALWSGGLIWEGLPQDAPVLESYLFYANQLLFHPQGQDQGEVKREFTVATPTDMMILQEDSELPCFSFEEEAP